MKRSEKLKNDFNRFWNNFFSTNVDYYSNVPFEKLIELKMAVSNINNLITYETTKMAVDVISDIFTLDAQEREKILIEIEETNENANGYDIEYENEKSSFICEVKANIPINGSSQFGSKQKTQIIKDINGLMHGKSKSHIASLDRFYKFMCFFSNGNTCEYAVSDFISKHNKRFDNRLVLFKGQETLSCDNVYIFFVVADGQFR